MARQVPFKKDGGLWFTEPKSNHPNLVWREPEIFEAEMKLVSYQKTAKGDFFLWADAETNATYPMTPMDLYSLLLKTFVEDGYVEAAWTVVPRDGRYGLQFVEELTD